MALKVERRGTTTDMIGKPELCHTCKQRKDGIFTVDAYNRPMCYDCAVVARRIAMTDA